MTRFENGRDPVHVVRPTAIDQTQQMVIEADCTCGATWTYDASRPGFSLVVWDEGHQLNGEVV